VGLLLLWIAGRLRQAHCRQDRAAVLSASKGGSGSAVMARRSDCSSALARTACDRDVHAEAGQVRAAWGQTWHVRTAGLRQSSPRRDAEFVQAYEREQQQHERVYRAAGARAYQDAPPTQDPVSVRFRVFQAVVYGVQ